MDKDVDKNSKKPIALYYLIAFVVETCVFFFYAWINGLFTKTEPVDIYKGLCDCFFVAGILGFGSGLLVCFANLGQFHFLSFAALKLLSKFIHSMSIATMSYGDYLEEKKESDFRFAYLLITGGAFLLASLIFLILFYQVYDPNAVGV